MLHRDYLTSQVPQDDYHSVISTDPGDELLSSNLMGIFMFWGYHRLCCQKQVPFFLWPAQRKEVYTEKLAMLPKDKLIARNAIFLSSNVSLISKEFSLQLEICLFELGLLTNKTLHHLKFGSLILNATFSFTYAHNRNISFKSHSY